MTTDADFKLCYVSGEWAWFTTQPVTEQWGDDWNDAPYECNAGLPYEYKQGDSKPPYELMKVAFYSGLEAPGDFGNSRWSVEQINRGSIAWLRTWDSKVNIFAGTTLPDFIGMVIASGGEIYRKVEVQR